jgi:hypothetical protein
MMDGPEALLVRLFVAVTEPERNELRRKDLFWFMGSEVLVGSITLTMREGRIIMVRS